MTLSFRSDTHTVIVYTGMLGHIAIENYKIAKSLGPVKNSHQLTKGDSMLFKRSCVHTTSLYIKNLP